MKVTPYDDFCRTSRTDDPWSIQDLITRAMVDVRLVEAGERQQRALYLLDIRNAIGPLIAVLRLDRGGSSSWSDLRPTPDAAEKNNSTLASCSK